MKFVVPYVPGLPEEDPEVLDAVFDRERIAEALGRLEVLDDVFDRKRIAEALRRLAVNEPCAGGGWISGSCSLSNPPLILGRCEEKPPFPRTGRSHRSHP